MEKGKSSPSLLVSSPSVLTPQGQKPLSSGVQGREKKLEHPPVKSKYGGSPKKKKVKQVWRVKDSNGLRFKPFHE